MSVREFFSHISDAYKGAAGSRLGHNFNLVAQTVGTETHIWDSTLPQCGPLYIVNDEAPWANSGATVSITYETAIVSGWATGYMYDLAYYYPLYTGVTGVYSASVEFISGRINQERLIEGNIHKINTFTVNPPLDISVYCLADNGMKMLYGMNTELEREGIYQLKKGVQASLSECQTCTGSKYYSGVLCPDCSGYGFNGKGTESFLLYQLGESVGIKRINENDESLALRIWARQWKMVPTPNEIKRYVSNFTRVDTGWITLEQNYSPECFFRVRLPQELVGTKYPDLQELLDNTVPIGVSAIIEPYYYLSSTSGIINYETVTNSGVCIFPKGRTTMPGMQWGNGQWGQYWYGEGISYTGTQGIGPCLSGTTTVADETNFFIGQSNDDIKLILYYDQPISGVTY